ncbi:MAG: GNAT family N-acetyltransferase [Clostridiales bacterium]|nr:GNAT family N-acetyltransferase [Clostridiales bacterium]
MKIRRVNEDKYIALDDEGREIGRSAVKLKRLDRIFPDCPGQISVLVRANDECRDLLYGAAVTRARLLLKSQSERTRVYAKVSPEDKPALEVLSCLGFAPQDGIMRMTRQVTDEKISLTAPDNCTIVRDTLEDDGEKIRCLRRYNECFAAEKDVSWLEELASFDNFRRILMVSPDDMCGEVMVWTSGDTGIIGIIQTARRWRRQGVAAYLMEDARKYFASLGIPRESMDVWIKAPGNMPLALKAGFVKREMLAVYPVLNK